MTSTAEKSKAILKKNDLESNSLSCDSWLLPEIHGLHTVSSKEARKIRKKSDKALENDLSEFNEDALKPINSSAGLEQSNSVSEVGDESALQNTANSYLQADLSIDKDLVPQKLSEFDEALTLKKLQSKVNQIQQEAWQVGHQEGMQAGLEAAKSKVEELQNNLGSQIEQLASQLDGLLTEQQQSLQSALHAVVIQIVEKLTAVSFQQDPEALHNILKEALDSYPKNAEKPTIRLCQSDLDLFKENSLLTDNCLWQVDESVATGGFFVTGKYAEIDHSFEMRLQQIIDQYFEN